MTEATPRDLGQRWLDEKQGTMTRRERLHRDAFPDLTDNERMLLESWLVEAVRFGYSKRAAVVALVRAARRAKNTIRAWHDMGIPSAMQERQWELYQKSPEMTVINDALAPFKHIEEE